MSSRSDRLASAAKDAYRRKDFGAALEAGMRAWEAAGRLDPDVGDLLWNAFAKWRWSGKGFTPDRGYAMAREIFERLERADVKYMHLLPDLHGVDPFGPELSHLRIHLGGRAAWGWWALEYARSDERRVDRVQRDAEARHLAPRVHKAIAALDYPMRADDVYHWLGEIHDWYGLPFPDWEGDHMLELQREKRAVRNSKAATQPAHAPPPHMAACWRCSRRLDSTVEECRFCGAIRPQSGWA